MVETEVTLHSDLAWAHPIVREWFINKFGTPTEPQINGWPSILAGRSTLISAPTGSGKTFAAFLACIDKLVRKALDGSLENITEVVYISPLKALSNDVQKNLSGPLAEIQALAHEKGLAMPEIRAVVRTGDTLVIDRTRMLKRPPHILVTTPESLYILLTADKSRRMLQNVQTVIVDEIHAIADSKRGSHMSLTLERLDCLTGAKTIRIGLSATQKPIELVGQFLVGGAQPLPEIITVGTKREIDVAVEVPSMPLEAVASDALWDELYKKLVVMVNKNRSTLVFVNTRKLAERLAMELGQRLGEDAVAAHHGSLSRKLRLLAEQRLKDGEIKVLVATSSLELGIDIGNVDLVCQISSPRAIAASIQRVGRAGHWRGAIPKGRFFATTVEDLFECSAIVHSVKSGDLDKLFVPAQPLDILAQQIVACCACESWSEDKLFELMTRAYPYRNLSRSQFDSVVQMLSEGIASDRYTYGTHLFRDQINGLFKGRRGSRLAAIMGGGAIPETAIFQVVAEPDGLVVGTLDEDFAIESSRGDVFLLGNTSWRVLQVLSRESQVSVLDARGEPPNVPFWMGEGPSRTVELSHQVSELRQFISEMTLDVRIYNSLTASSAAVLKTIEVLKSRCGVSEIGAEQLIEHIVNGRVLLKVVPTEKTIIAERFFDEFGGTQIVIHSIFGARINRAWGLALRNEMRKTFKSEFQTAATDNGIIIALPETVGFPLRDIFRFCTAGSIQDTLLQAAVRAPAFATRFRWDAQRSLMLAKFSGGKKVPPNLQRIRADELMQAVFPMAAHGRLNDAMHIEIPEHPLIDEVMKDVLTDWMDLAGLKKIFADFDSGKIQCVSIDTPMPSVFSHEILNANPYAYLDDAPIEERRSRAVSTRRSLPDSLVKEIGALDEVAIQTIVSEVAPDIRDADELHDFLQTVVALPTTLKSEYSIFAGIDVKDNWGTFFEQLQKSNRATEVEVNGRYFFVSTERMKEFCSVYHGANILAAVPNLPEKSKYKLVDDETKKSMILADMLRGWMQHLGPITVQKLQDLLDVDKLEVERTLLNLESEGAVLRGKFTSEFLNTKKNDPLSPELDLSTDPTVLSNYEWCDRRILARIHRLTVSTLRRQVEAVTASQYMHWLAHWQHVAPGSLLSGEHGTLEVLRQLQGFEAPANVWEREIIARRVIDYTPRFLDKLCMNGSIGWGRLSPHPAFLEESSLDKESSPASRRITPTSVAPVTFFVRADSDWIASKRLELDENSQVLSSQARAVKDFLQQRGASFFADIVRGNTLLKSEIEMALWELVAAGLVTADGFDNLRSLIDPKRRSGQGRASRPRDSSGRWSLLHADVVNDRAKMTQAICLMLLKRYGVVFRDLIARESLTISWRELLQMYRLMEARGEIRGGRFVNGFLGEQFALPEALDSLRKARLESEWLSDIKLAATDPLNLQGIIIPGQRVAAHSGKHITFV